MNFPQTAGHISTTFGAIPSIFSPGVCTATATNAEKPSTMGTIPEAWAGWAITPELAPHFKKQEAQEG
jgi:hypothetical protein